MHPTNCLNCGSGLGTGHKFCSICGQKANTHRLNLHEIGHDALHYITHADKGIFYLVRELALRPGRVAREYVAGRRTKYFKPVNFFLIIGTILVFMTTTFYRTNETYAKQIEQAAVRMNDQVKQQQLLARAERIRKVDHFLGRYSHVMNMLATPLFAFILWLCFRKAGYSFIEHLVASLYIVSFSMLCYALLFVPWQPQLFKLKLAWLLMLVYFVADIFYRAAAYYHFIGKKGFLPFVKAFGISLLTVLIWVTGTYLLIQQYIKTGF